MAIDAQLKAAEPCGRQMLETEPRALSAHYDEATGRVVLDLANGCTYAFPAPLVQIFKAQATRIWLVLWSMASASTFIGRRWTSISTSRPWCLGYSERAPG